MTKKEKKSCQTGASKKDTHPEKNEDVKSPLDASVLVPGEPAFATIDPGTLLRGDDYNLQGITQDEPQVDGVSQESINQLTFKRRGRASNYDSDDDEEAINAAKVLEEVRKIQESANLYDAMMKAGSDDTMAPLEFFKQLMRLGLDHQDIKIRQKWTKLEPTIVALMANQQQSIATLVTGIMPCTLGEICTYVYGINEGTRLHVTERLDAVERNMSDMVDSLKVMFSRMETSYKDHISQTIQFAAQVNNASKSLASSVAGFEKLLIQVSENMLKMPVVNPAPSVVSVETGHSVHQPPKKPSLVPRQPSLLDPVPKEKPGVSTTEISADGLYSGSYMSFRIVDGEAVQFKITVSSMKFLNILQGSRSKLISCILCAPATALVNMEKMSPGWLTRLMSSSAKDKVKFIEKNFGAYRRNPVSWTYFPPEE